MAQAKTADRPGGEERAARARIDAAGKLLRGGKDDAPDDFAALLFAGTAPEDLVAYEAADLATLARDAFAFLSTRKPGAPKIRFAAPKATGDDCLRSVSVIEIVNDDMPFLLDSVMGELAERGLAARLVAHPILAVERDKAGKLKAAPGPAQTNGGETRESFIHVHVDAVAAAPRRDEVVAALDQVLAQVRRCVQDWKPMLGRVADVIKELKTNPPPLPVDDIAEAIQFLEWIAADNFTLFGVRDYAFSGKDRDLKPVANTGLGLLRDDDVSVFTRGGQAVTMTPQLRAFFDEPKTLIVMKANAKSRVHRRAYLDYVGVKRFDKDGNPQGEFRIVGLFTSTAYTRSTRGIPYLRRKVDSVLRRAGFDPLSHSGKALTNIIESYPRDELFQIDEDTLYDFAMAILRLDVRPRLRVLARRDPFDRFVSVLVYVPRERFDSGVRARIGQYLAEAYKGHVSAFYPSFPEGALNRVHFIIGRSGGETPNPDRTTLEQAVGAIVRTWADVLGEALAESLEPAAAREAFERYRTAFSEGYREVYSPLNAVADIRTIETLSPDRPLSVDFYHRASDEKACVGLKVWSHRRPIPLSERVPVLENMGFRVVDEQTYHVASEAPDNPGTWLHDMTLERADGAPVESKALKGPLETCFIMVMRGFAENDGYNALVMAAGLGWRDVALVRTVSRFLRQIRVPYSQDYMWATLRKHAGLAAKIVDLFHARFDPSAKKADRGKREGAIAAEMEEALKSVESLDEDRIVRHFINAVQSAIRTNYYQLGADGQPKPLIAIKFQSRKLDGMPKPAPLYEIFVYSPRVEGDHLRFGKVARGGIRWSDRPQDFRTEVLGLVKAQQVKNAVIVPVGSKGGYVPKHLPVGGPRDAIQAEGTAAYKLFISTLLDITDNLDLKDVVPPKDVVRHDDDDPYLVVAADKGTATFSDIANSISEEHGFWLGDAFASGGSAGYDHKGMGITARGAWESVKRHFREMNVDITTHGIHHGRRRRHVGRRVRQRHAARDHDEAPRGVRPPRHLHRSRSRSEGELRRAQAHVRAAAVELAGLRQEADLQGRRHIPALGQGDRAVERGAESNRPRQGQGDAAGGDERHPEGAGRSAVLRRHRHLHPRLDGKRRGRRRPRQRSDPHHRQGCPRQGDRRGRQPRHDPARPHRGGAARACGSTPTPSTTRPASTPPTSRSTSRSR